MTQAPATETAAFNEAVARYLPELGDLTDMFDQMVWAEEEIVKAMARHGEQAPPEGKRGQGPIWNGFRLLRATHGRLGVEVLYRAHCRELLERIATKQDTRPATDAEIVVLLLEASVRSPLNSAAVCLYFRLGVRSVPGMAQALGTIDLAAYERVHGHQADDYEAEVRRKLAQPWRC